MSYLSKYVLFAIVLLFPYLLQADTPKPKRKTVCVNMIVKNEKEVITRCLTSVLPIIDSWVIVDTGSTDGTQKIIINFMKEKGVSGELHERPWKNFEHNRNEALELAKGKADYVLFIDADEYLVFEKDFKLPALEKDYYYMTIKCGGTEFSKIMLINNQQDWKWEGVLHEVICPPITRSFATLEKLVNIYTTDGARSKDPKKFEKDAEILEAAVKDNPKNERNVFYLAQSYYAADKFEEALKNYEKRATLGGWEQEAFWSYLKVGVLKERLKKSKEEVVDSYKRAFQFRPTRIEPLYYLSKYYQSCEDFKAAYEVTKVAKSIPLSRDILFVEKWMYEWGAILEFSINAYWAGHYKESHDECLALLKIKDLPDNVRECVEKNLGFANAKLIETIGVTDEKSLVTKK